MNAIFIFACLVLAVVPGFFILHHVYEDGLIGRLALAGISFTSIMFLLEVFFGDDELEVLPLTVSLASAFAVFLCWHLFRFHRRVLRKST